MHPSYLSNAYLVADEEGGSAVYVDSGAPLEPLTAAVAGATSASTTRIPTSPRLTGGVSPTGTGHVACDA